MKTATVFRHKENQSYWNIQMDDLETDFEGFGGLTYAVSELAQCAGVRPSDIQVSFCEEWYSAGEAAHDLHCEIRNEAFFE